MVWRLGLRTGVTEREGLEKSVTLKTGDNYVKMNALVGIWSQRLRCNATLAVMSVDWGSRINSTRWSLYP